MIYLEETFDLEPASPETLDRFVEFAEGSLVPAYQSLGARLAAAWTCNSERFGQVKQVLEFDDLGALGAFREEARNDESWLQCGATLEELAPRQHSRLMESLGPIPPETTHAAAAESQNSPVGAYSLAILRVALEIAASSLPIVAAWRTIAGRSNEVTDLWKGALGQSGYQPADEAGKPFFRRLRQLAPDERLLNVYPLPYSPLLWLPGRSHWREESLMLSPYRVLDLTNERGLLCGQILADLGADVIAVEPPGGNSARRLGPFADDEPGPERSLYWWAYSRNKRSVTLDIATDEGRELLLRLTEEAHFLIESDRPGRMAGLGLLPQPTPR